MTTTTTAKDVVEATPRTYQEIASSIRDLFRDLRTAIYQEVLAQEVQATWKEIKRRSKADSWITERLEEMGKPEEWTSRWLRRTPFAHVLEMFDGPGPGETGSYLLSGRDVRRRSAVEVDEGPPPAALPAKARGTNRKGAKALPAGKAAPRKRTPRSEQTPSEEG